MRQRFNLRPLTSNMSPLPSGRREGSTCPVKVRLGSALPPNGAFRVEGPSGSLEGADRIFPFGRRWDACVSPPPLEELYLAG